MLKQKLNKLSIKFTNDGAFLNLPDEFDVFKLYHHYELWSQSCWWWWWSFSEISFVTINNENLPNRPKFYFISMSTLLNINWSTFHIAEHLRSRWTLRNAEKRDITLKFELSSAWLCAWLIFLWVFHISKLATCCSVGQNESQKCVGLFLLAINVRKRFITNDDDMIRIPAYISIVFIVYAFV